MDIRECITPALISITPEESVTHAARLMARCNLGSLPVRTAGGRLVGIVTDRDLVLRCMAAGKNPTDTPIREVMTANPITVHATDSMDKCAELMAARQVRRLPVVDKFGRLCGMCSLSDLLKSREYRMEAAACLTEINKNIKKWEKTI